ncbi:MAG TPA: hypothetical protein VJ225_05000 [Nitrososphaeraceae archaeon]|nr:hypothetical protein [Nitrososphaeraceae archaeon]
MIGQSWRASYPTSEFRLMTGANQARKDNFMLACNEMYEVLSL